MKLSTRGALQSSRDVFNWEIPGTKHLFAVSETKYGIRAYLRT